MLVLSRKRSERIRIDKNIWVTITEIRGDKVIVGIDAPDEIQIFREEKLPEKEHYLTIVLEPKSNTSAEVLVGTKSA